MSGRDQPPVDAPTVTPFDDASDPITDVLALAGIDVIHAALLHALNDGSYIGIGMFVPEAHDGALPIRITIGGHEAEFYILLTTVKPDSSHVELTPDQLRALKQEGRGRL